jgi:carboxylesterase
MSVRVAGLLLTGGLACGGARMKAPPSASRHADRQQFSEALDQIGRDVRAESAIVRPGGGSLLRSHGAPTSRVFVLLHGFTDSPRQFEPLGDRLFTNDDNVFIPRLPHHAERDDPIRALGRIRVDDLTRFADHVVDVARGLGDTIVVVGLSAGGTVAAWMAQHRPEVRRAVLVAPALAAGSVSDQLARGAVVAGTVLPDVRRPEEADSTRPGFTPGLTSRGLGNLLLLGDRVRSEAVAHAPRAEEIVFVLNERDHTVSERAALDLAQQWHDHGARVDAYRFPDKRHLPHNVLEERSRGGDPDRVLAVLEALALGRAPSDDIDRMREPCRGIWCAVRRAVEKPSTHRRSAL